MNAWCVRRYDLTQGPSCALACPGATVFRNYFVPVRKQQQVGKKNSNQVSSVPPFPSLLEIDRNKKHRDSYQIGQSQRLQLDLMQSAGAFAEQLATQQLTGHSHDTQFWTIQNGCVILGCRSGVGVGSSAACSVSTKKKKISIYASRTHRLCSCACPRRRGLLLFG